ncbi:hypothetical protein [Okeania sp.]|uniref:hypothetical protein n=1 Tax=Okeania sp. TaxID=3100323 RepID=UPI002B4B6AD1|nr:hypothetical protein [Okeania sp.]MEB3342844.1 hypothetical protein [Okeania sp.]
MRYKFYSFISFFLLSVSGLLWVNYYSLISQVNAQVIAQKSPSSQYILDRLQEIIFNAKEEQSEPPETSDKNTSRGDDFCLIAPWLYKLENSSEQIFVEVFREQPIFIWQKDAGAIFIQNPETQETIWAEVVDYGVRKMVYSGQTLEKGKIYHLFLHEGDTTSSPFPFKIISGNRRKTIEAELQKLEKKAGAASAEEMALLRADYFLKQGLL